MTIQIILLVVGLILIFFLAFKLLKGVVKALISVAVIGVLILGVFGVLIYLDAMTLKRGFEEDKTVIIMFNQELVSGFRVVKDVSGVVMGVQDFYVSLSSEELGELSEQIVDNFKHIDDEGLVLVVDQKVFYDDELSVWGSDLVTSEEKLSEFSMSSNKEEIISILIEMGVSEEVIIELQERDVDDIKNNLYYKLFLNKLKTTKGKFLIEEIKNKNIITQPELLSMKFFNLFPSRLMEVLAE